MGFGLSRRIFIRSWGRGQLYLGAAVKTKAGYKRGLQCS